MLLLTEDRNGFNSSKQMMYRENILFTPPGVGLCVQVKIVLIALRKDPLTLTLWSGSMKMHIQFWEMSFQWAQINILIFFLLLLGSVDKILPMLCTYYSLASSNFKCLCFL